MLVELNLKHMYLNLIKIVLTNLQDHLNKICIYLLCDFSNRISEKNLKKLQKLGAGEKK